MVWYFLVLIIFLVILAFVINNYLNVQKYVNKYKRTSKNNLKKGDILFSHVTIFGYTNIVNWHIPGYWTHPGIFCGFDKNRVGWVVEATIFGVRKVTLECFLVRGSCAVGRVKGADSKIIDNTVKWAESKIGAAFNWIWLTKSTAGKRFYCSELVWASYKNLGIDLDSNPCWYWKYAWAVAPQEIFESPHINILGILEK